MRKALGWIRIGGWELKGYRLIQHKERSLKTNAMQRVYIYFVPPAAEVSQVFSQIFLKDLASLHMDSSIGRNPITGREVLTMEGKGSIRIGGSRGFSCSLELEVFTRKSYS